MVPADATLAVSRRVGTTSSRPGAALGASAAREFGAAGLAAEGWSEVTYAGLCDQRNATDAVLVRDLVAGHSDVARMVTWVTLAVTTAGAMAIIKAVVDRGAQNVYVSRRQQPLST